jgi:uncharacterized protein (DUF2147 family)
VTRLLCGNRRSEAVARSNRRGALGTALLMLVMTSLAHASPVGLWKTIDDRTDEATGIIEITEKDGRLFGQIVEILDPKAKPDAICGLCTDERKDAPIVGLTIIRNVEANDATSGPWEGGDILDPNDGKVYRVRLKLADGGNRLEVRGYIGAPMFGRTQVWHRAE